MSAAAAVRTHKRNDLMPRSVLAGARAPLDRRLGRRLSLALGQATRLDQAGEIQRDFWGVGAHHIG